ncbi:GSCFA domain-containing protein [Yoonia sp. SS1-5]|uniref:GSCFA domain-containing protein n=1 Tax=Yoonia rhodophyticola TaxID=3137370 RepID=A0AAN0NKC0_9RHOB
MPHPYQSMPPRAFWRSGTRPDDSGLLTGLYQPRFTITPETAIATAGSCFAQHIGRALRAADCNLLDIEPPIRRMPAEIARQFGYEMFSARYGNIYTPRQLRELLQDVQNGAVDPGLVWQKDGRFFDALRPGVEPIGLETADDVLVHRHYHLERVGQMLRQADLFIFTLGLAEAWVDQATGRTLPVCPGVIAGTFDDTQHRLHCFKHAEVLADLTAIRDLLHHFQPTMKILLTLSPVPLTATARAAHVLTATSAAKSTLRAAVDENVQEHADADYFPAYEIVTSSSCGGPWFGATGRHVRPEGVEHVMRYFFTAHGLPNLSAPQTDADTDEDDLACEDILLQAFAP